MRRVYLRWSILLFVTVMRIAYCDSSSFAADQFQMVVGEWNPEEQIDESPSVKGGLNMPFGVDFDAEGNMWIVELEGGRVFRLDAQCKLSQMSGNGQEGFEGDGESASQGVFRGMHNVAVTPEGDVYIADSWNHRIRRIDRKTGLLSTVTGDSESGYAGDGQAAQHAKFSDIMCATFNSKHDKLYLADIQNRRVRLLDLKSMTLLLIAGNGGQSLPTDGAVAAESPLVDPRAVAVDAEENVYVLERTGNALRRVSPDGRIVTVAGTGEAGFRDGPARTAMFNSPKHLCIGPEGVVFIADDSNSRIRKYDPKDESVSTVLGEGSGHERIRLLHPHGVTYEKDRLYVVDSGNNRIFSLRP